MPVVRGNYVNSPKLSCYTIPVTTATAEHSFSACISKIKEFNDSTETKPLCALACAPQRDSSYDIAS